MPWIGLLEAHSTVLLTQTGPYAPDLTLCPLLPHCLPARLDLRSGFVVKRTSPVSPVEGIRCGGSNSETGAGQPRA